MDPCARFTLIAALFFSLFFSYFGLITINDSYFLFKSLVTRWAAAIRTGETQFDLQKAKFGSPIPWEGLEAPLMVLNQTACNLDLPPLEGVIAMVPFGDCWIDKKATNLQEKGALAAVFVSSDALKTLPSLDSSLDIKIPSFVLSSNDFEVLRWTNEVTIVRTPDLESLTVDYFGLIGVSIISIIVMLLSIILVVFVYENVKRKLEERAKAKKQKKYQPVALDNLSKNKRDDDETTLFEETTV